METPKEYYYTYYSYEEWGRGYIGSRGCECLPEEDIKYFGSFKDKTFKPTQKIILQTYDTREEADADEVILHEYFEVDINPHFANRARQTSSKFRVPKEMSVEIGRRNALKLLDEGRGCCFMDPEKKSEISRRNGKINGNLCKEKKIGICGRSPEKMREDGIKGGKVAGNLNKELKRGICGLTPEERKENSRKGGLINGPKVGKENVELQRGFFALSKEERRKYSQKAGNKNKETGFIYELGKIQGKKNAESGHLKEIAQQKWQCTETGFISGPGPLTQYQKKRGIDTSKRRRIS